MQKTSKQKKFTFLILFIFYVYLCSPVNYWIFGGESYLILENGLAPILGIGIVYLAFFIICFTFILYHYKNKGSSVLPSTFKTIGITTFLVISALFFSIHFSNKLIDKDFILEYGICVKTQEKMGTCNVLYKFGPNKKTIYGKNEIECNEAINPGDTVYVLKVSATDGRFFKIMEEYDSE